MEPSISGKSNDICYSQGPADTQIWTRGAGASKGRTSWTSKPETYDYISFVGFFFHYLHALRLPHRGEPTLSSLTAPLTPIPTGVTLERHSGEVQPHLTLILSGYSYGSLITTYLPPIETILERFAQVKPGTSEAEIRLRASSLASQWNQEAQMHIDMLNERGLKAPSMRRTSPNPTALAMGGEESEPGTRRLSQESRRSRDLVRKSFERSHIHFGRRISAEENKHSVESAHRVLPYTLVAPRICYLLISPLLPPVASLATFFTHASHTRSTKSSISAAGDIDHRLASHPTLVIYGGRDFFISQKKLRAWAQPIFKRPSSLFRFHEIAGAGHFWHESSAEADMRRFVREWVGKIE